MPAPAKLDAIREGWLSGIGLQLLSARDADAREISKDLYGYQLPWIIHAAAQQLRSEHEAGKADVLANLALLVELGVPSERAARIFLAGVRSRSSAAELAALNVDFGLSISEIGRNLRDPKLVEKIRPLVSAEIAGWLELMVADGSRWRRAPVPEFPSFKLKGSEATSKLHARRLGDSVFLTSTEATTRIEVEVTQDFPFDRAANDPRIAFTKSDGVWSVTIRDPRLEPRDEGRGG